MIVNAKAAVNWYGKAGTLPPPLLVVEVEVPLVTLMVVPSEEEDVVTIAVALVVPVIAVEVVDVGL